MLDIVTDEELLQLCEGTEPGSRLYRALKELTILRALSSEAVNPLFTIEDLEKALEEAERAGERAAEAARLSLLRRPPAGSVQ